MTIEQIQKKIEVLEGQSQKKKDEIKIIQDRIKDLKRKAEKEQYKEMIEIIKKENITITELKDIKKGVNKDEKNNDQA